MVLKNIFNSKEYTVVCKNNTVTFIMTFNNTV